MRRAIEVAPAGSWPAARAKATVTLTSFDRYRRRFRMAEDGGAEFLLDLPQAVQLADGDGLRLEEGGYIRVVAAPEEVIDITCTSPADLARVAWHVGNRHLPLQVVDSTTLRILDDPVVVAMLDGLGVRTVRRLEPFAPESRLGHGGEDGHHHP